MRNRIRIRMRIRIRIRGEGAESKRDLIRKPYDFSLASFGIRTRMSIRRWKMNLGATAFVAPTQHLTAHLFLFHSPPPPSLSVAENPLSSPSRSSSGCERPRGRGPAPRFERRRF